MSRVRVWYIAHVARLGGGERSLVDLLSVLDRGEFAPEAVVPGRGELTEALDAIDVPWQAVPYLGRLHRPRRLVGALGEGARLVLGIASLRRRIGSARPHLVHANSTTAALYAAHGACRLGIPLIWHLRDLARSGRIERWLARRSTRVVAPSRAVAALVARLGAGDRCALIASGIDVGRFAALAPRASRRTPGERGPLVVSIGQLVGWKNHDLLLDAARELHRRQPAVRFLLVGDDRFGEDHAAAGRLRARITALGLESVVTLASFCPDVAPALAEADLLVHAAYPEPFGRVVVEALAAGLPVVAFGGDHGPAEIVRDGIDGVLAAPRTAAALADAVERVIADPDRARLGAAGRRRAVELYGRERTARSCEALYREVLAARRDR